MDNLPLKGVRISDFSVLGTGPYCTQLLGFLGAQVIRIEDRGGKRDWVYRIRNPKLFADWNLNKLSLTLDLKKPEAVHIAKRLVKISDVVVENLRPGAMERLGLSYKALRQVKSDIIMASCSGFGQQGPESHYATIAASFATMGGLAGITGYSNGMPTEQRGVIDCYVGQVLAFSIMAALFYRRKTGKGQYIDLSATEVVCSHIGDRIMEYTMNGWNPLPQGNRDDIMAPHNCYRCRGQDKWVSIAVGTEGEWKALCQAIGQPELAQDPRFCDMFSRWKNQEEVDRLIEAWTVNYTPYEVTTKLQSVGVAAFPSVSSEDVFNDTHLKENGFLLQIEDSEFGQRVHLAPPWRLSASPERMQRRAPKLGEHNAYILGELLGLPSEEIRRLEQMEVV